MKPMSLKFVCDICGRKRSHGDWPAIHRESGDFFARMQPLPPAPESYK
jgi:hypothetical protein